jgi:hypothetical protein
MIRLGYKGYWVIQDTQVSLRSSRVKCLLVAQPIGLTLEHVKPWDVEISKAERVMRSNSVCFQLCDRTVICRSHLARPCEVFHKRVGKTCGTIYDRSRDVRPELGIQSESHLPTGVRHTTRVVSYDWSWAYDWIQAYDRSCVFWPESGIGQESCVLTEVRHMTGVEPSDQSRAYDWSRAYDKSHVFWPESGIRPELRIQPESCLLIGVMYTTGVTPSDRSWAYDRSRVFWPELRIRLEPRIQLESHLLTGVGHTTGVMHMTRATHTTGVASSDRSRAYDRSRVFWPESWDTYIISMYNG